MQILVTGASGFLGSNICTLAVQEGHRVVGTVHYTALALEGCQARKLDIQNEAACLQLCEEVEPDVVIHSARYSAGLGKCERERETAYKINVTGTRNMVQAACKAGARFVYISSDWIFDGRKKLGEKYEEDESPCPLNYYGFTKWAGEQEVRTGRIDWLILRPANIYGIHASFLEDTDQWEETYLQRTSWAHKIAIKLLKGEAITLPDTLYQTPTLANHLAEVALLLLEQGRTGVFHVGSRECISRYQFAKALAETLGLNSGLISKGSLRKLEASWGVPQGIEGILPANTCLDIHKIEETIKSKMLNLDEGLERMNGLFKQWAASGGAVG